jgi:hypothetical protein
MLVHHWQLRNESSVEPSAISNQEYSGNKLVTISIVFIILNCVFVLLRFYARSITRATYGWDDYLIIAGFISNIGLCVVSIGTYALFYHLPLSLWYQFASHGEIAKQLNYSRCLSRWRGAPYLGCPRKRPQVGNRLGKGSFCNGFDLPPVSRSAEAVSSLLLPSALRVPQSPHLHLDPHRRRYPKLGGLLDFGDASM